jgi:hypothetical protein
MRSTFTVVALAAIAALAAFTAPTASAEFGVATFDGEVLAGGPGEPFSQAGGHPFEASTTIAFNRLANEGPDENVKTISVDLPLGFVGNPNAVPFCPEAKLGAYKCPNDSQVGVITLSLPKFGLDTVTFGVYNMRPAPGYAAAFGFNVLGGSIVHLNARVRPDDTGVSLDIPNISQTIAMAANRLSFWGDPSDEAHRPMRGGGLICYGGPLVGPPLFCERNNEPSTNDADAFLTLPDNCSAGPVDTILHTDSWQHIGTFREYTWTSHLPPGYPAPPSEWGPAQGVTDCSSVPFDPEITAQPTTERAEAPTGLNVTLSVPDTGFRNPEGITQAYMKKAVVKLPEGMTINPSAGEGLGVCTEADLARETATSLQGEGCPNSSKIGTVRVETPALIEPLSGALYIAKQYDNPFHSLLAMYIVVKSPERGVILTLPGKVVPDPRTGQLTTTFDDNPQVPFSKFTLSFREGQRSPLVSPPACGTYPVEASFVPWTAADPDNPTAGETVTRVTTFDISKGVGGGGCVGDTSNRPFAPGLQAGTLNNNAGSFSPFDIRMTRNDGEQEITSFSAELPPGLSGKLAGVPNCSDADIARAATKTGLEETENPSCPTASQVGRTLVGAGVGSVLAYAPGKVYLAGPYHGSPLSVAAITAATVGPFDLGTVVVRSALRIDPLTARVSVDSAGSDPIPHILQGIQLHVRDVRVYMDRPDFTLNPTSCDPFEVKARLTGSGADVASPADDVAAGVASPFQAANCANLGFKPKLAFKLKGGTHRGDYPALTATLTGRPGDANIAKAAVVLPHSEFLAQEHIRTVCTRVQFAANACPPASVYGHAQAVSPLLDEPLEGPVYLRSSSNKLPDLVAALNGRFNVVLSGRIDSVNQGIRNTFDVVPDAPVTKFTLSMQGGKKGLLVNSRNLCKGVNRAGVRLTGQNGKTYNTKPVVANTCKKARKGKKAKKH